MSVLLELKNVNKSFGGVQAVKDMSFVLEEGELAGLMGPNGAGKTTVFNLISSVYDPDSGEIIFGNKNITRLRAYQVVRIGIARTFQNLRLFSRSTVLENMMTAMQNRHIYSFRENLVGNMLPACRPNPDYHYGFIESLVHWGGWNSKEKKIREASMELLERVNLADRAEQVSGTLPYGMQRRLEIARALALNPTLLMLDEPAAGMNEEEVLALNELIKGIHEDFSLTILVIEHHMDLIMEICPHVICMNFGAKIAEGSPDVIQKDPEVLRAYLGADDEEVA
ncbi:MAG: ABC transporter ATP-binding protein [Synergistaceae bacterium]|nr:ABC transporter ATP-binding protein [Synergistaceae bacterium]